MINNSRCNTKEEEQDMEQVCHIGYRKKAKRGKKEKIP